MKINIKENMKNISFFRRSKNFAEANIGYFAEYIKDNLQKLINKNTSNLRQ